MLHALKVLTSDVSNLSVGTVSGVIAALLTGSAISFPIVPVLPGIGAAVGCLLITRMSIEIYCSEDNKNDN